MSQPVPHDQLRIGKIYRIEFSDCCVGGQFTVLYLGCEKRAFSAKYYFDKGSISGEFEAYDSDDDTD